MDNWNINLVSKMAAKLSFQSNIEFTGVSGADPRIRAMPLITIYSLAIYFNRAVHGGVEDGYKKRDEDCPFPPKQCGVKCKKKMVTIEIQGERISLVNPPPLYTYKHRCTYYGSLTCKDPVLLSHQNSSHTRRTTGILSVGEL